MGGKRGGGGTPPGFRVYLGQTFTNTWQLGQVFLKTSYDVYVFLDRHHMDSTHTLTGCVAT